MEGTALAYCCWRWVLRLALLIAVPWGVPILFESP